jgi:hypothetical protein
MLSFNAPRDNKGFKAAAMLERWDTRQTAIACLFVVVASAWFGPSCNAQNTIKFAGEEIDCTKLFSFKTFRLGMELDEFEKVEFPVDGDTEPKVIVCRSDQPKFPLGFDNSSGQRLACIHAIEKDGKFNHVNTTIANVPVRAFFMFQKFGDTFRLARIDLMGSATQIDAVKAAITTRYGEPERVMDTIPKNGNLYSIGTSDRFAWRNSASGIVLTNTGNSFDVVYAIRGFEGTRQGRPASQDL